MYIKCIVPSVLGFLILLFVGYFIINTDTEPKNAGTIVIEQEVVTQEPEPEPAPSWKDFIPIYWGQYRCSEEQMTLLEREMSICTEIYKPQDCYMELKVTYCTPPEGIEK